MTGSLAFLVTEDSPVIAAPEHAGIFALESSWINWFAPVPTSSTLLHLKFVKFRLTFVFLIFDNQLLVIVEQSYLLYQYYYRLL